MVTADVAGREKKTPAPRQFGSKTLAAIAAACFAAGGGGSTLINAVKADPSPQIQVLQGDIATLKLKVEKIEAVREDVQILKATVDQRFAEASRERERQDRNFIKMDAKIDRLIERK